MNRIKIRSNPYENEIIYSKQNLENEWEIVSNESSKLLSEKFSAGVFPFIVKDIVDVIINEFSCGDEPIEIVFEGTNDEFLELESICKDDKYINKVTAVKSDTYLENARDIVDNINEIFKKIDNLVSDSAINTNKVEFERRQFNDVNKKVIPLCIIGNVSSGKSTFINSLIGYEVLPSGSKPLTAKIHKISRSSNSDSAKIKFIYNDNAIEISFRYNTEPSIIGGTEQDSFLDIVFETVMDSDNDSIFVQVNKTLGAMNNNAKGVAAKSLSDIIEVEVPFNTEGILGKSQHEYVLLDTPGSNSASNTEHLEVLKSAMQNLSNGLLIFISTYKSLDTTDNVSLSDEILGIKELDSRFTMIAVNQCEDDAIEETEEEILDMAVPKHLYKNGIYFISSVMGLGAKIDGEFTNNNYAKIFRKNKDIFDDNENEDYTCLYTESIMPEQLKKKELDESQKCKNLIYSNSGLFMLERQIETFAGKYSPYNKCNQSLMFLHKVVEITEEDIQGSVQRCEEKKANFSNQLKEGEKALILKIEEDSKILSENAHTDFVSSMQPLLDEVYVPLEKNFVDDKEREFHDAEQANTDLDEQNKDANAAISSARDELISAGSIGLKQLINKEGWKNVGEHIEKSFEHIKDFGARKQETRFTNQEIDKVVSDKLLQYVKEQFSNNMEQAQEILYQASVDFWTQRTNEIKKALIKIVSGAETLAEDEREKLKDVILSYAAISFRNQVDTIFMKGDFEKKLIKLFGIVLFEDYTLDKRKLVRTHNITMKNEINSVYEQIWINHRESFDNWVYDLLKIIEENITSFNPDLYKLVQYIKDEERSISSLKNRQEELNRYTQQITDMMTWKTLND